MIITKVIEEIKTYADGSVGAVIWKIITEENGIQTEGLVRTLFNNYDTSTIDLATITDSELLDICTTIQGGQMFIDEITQFHSGLLQEEYEISLMTDFNVPLDKLKANKLQEISLACETAIVSGFESDALGTPHTYQSDRDDQLNLIGMVTANIDDYFKCFDGTTWSYKLHTAAQLHQVLIDGKNIKLLHLQKFNTLKGQIEIAQSEAEINSIVW